MMVEQITYVLHPGKAPALVEAYEREGLAVIRASLGRLVAFLVAETGDMDEVSHIWAFEDAADRERRHARLMGDPNWRAFTQAYGHLLVSRRTQLWRSTSFSPAPG